MRMYEAVVAGDKVKWLGDAPDPTKSVRVQITVLDEDAASPNRSDGAAMVAALEELARRNADACFGDPVEWQREIRKDRPLHGRD